MQDFTQYDQFKDSTDVIPQDLTPGTGAEAISGTPVMVHYRGYLTNGTVFDESYKRGQPFSFTPGAGMVIRGWEEGVPGMKVGGSRRLIVPPAAGYGDRAVSVIPGGSVLVFDIELLAVGE